MIISIPDLCTLTYFNAEIPNQDWYLRLKNKSVDEKWNIFKDVSSDLLEKYVPHKLFKPSQKLDPPLTRSKDVKRARRKRREAWKQVKTRNLHSNKVFDEKKQKNSNMRLT